MNLRNRKGAEASADASPPENPADNEPPAASEHTSNSLVGSRGRKTPRQLWEDKLEELRRFKETHGHVHVPKNEEYKQLGRFVNNQRQFYRKRMNDEKNSLTDERIRALEELGFAWTMPKPVSEHRAQALQAQWEQRIEELKAYKKVHGDCNVATKENRELGKFVMNQRHYYKARLAGQKNSLTPERIQDLENIGFVWNMKGVKSDDGKFLNNEEKWNRNFEELKRYKETFGHVNVVKTRENQELGQFVGNQRYLYRRRLKGESTSLTDDRIKILSDLGFEWKARDTSKSKVDVTLKTKGGSQILEKDKEVALSDGSKVDYASKETSEKRMVLLEDGSYILEVTTKTYTTKVEHIALPQDVEEDMNPDTESKPPALPDGGVHVTESQKETTHPDGSTSECTQQESCKKRLVVQLDGTQLLEIKTTTCVTKIERMRLPEESEAEVEMSSADEQPVV